MSIRSYHDLLRLHTFEERYQYLRLRGLVGEETFGFSRYLNQSFYASPEWKRARAEVIARDNACDLGIEDRMIFDKVIIHHMNPVTRQQMEHISDYFEDLVNPEFLICVSNNTHNAIHYGDGSLLISLPTERRMNDTIPWR